MLDKPIIVVGTDFSSHSDEALKAAEEIRKRTKGELHLVHITSYPPDWIWLNDDLIMNYQELNKQDELIQKIEARLDQQARRCEVQCTREAYFGKPYTGLLDTVKKQKAHLLVLGHQGGGATHAFTGGLTTKIVSSCPVPLLVVKKPLSVQKVAGLVDTTDLMPNVFSEAEELSFLFSAELEYISVWQDISAEFGKGPTVAPITRFTYSEEERSKILRSMETSIGEFMDERSKGKVMVEISFEKSTSDSLKKKLAAEKIDLAVMARHRRGMLERMIIGSVTKRLLDLAEGNLMILPPP